LPRIPHDKPWWFSRHNGGSEITEPEGIEQRYADYQYPALFPALDALTDATEWHEYASLKYEIESIRSHPEIQGYVITEFTDVNWESNGLLDVWRNPKAFAGSLGKLERDDVLALRTEKRNYSPGETVTVMVSLSHYSQETLRGGSIAWKVEGTSLAGTLSLPSLPAASVAPVGKIEFAAPSTPVAARKALNVEMIWRGKAWRRIPCRSTFIRLNNLNCRLRFRSMTRGASCGGWSMKCGLATTLRRPGRRRCPS
jgi:hypothetical protein